MYSSLKPTITFKREGDSAYMNFEMAPGAAHSCRFKFNEEFDSKDERMDPPAFHNKETAALREDGVMTFTAKTQITGPGKVDTYSEYFVKDDELHTPMNPLGNRSISGNRIYKKVKAVKQ
ncbi:uncharacterized protein LOC128558150 [Mercenaria mercenaria]|uniref:uncharacterized protein LOC128558150 n=1 Tax=Mercenaria mercenaria TaxID=6596 RepID=UPI00234F6E27|nr:uncharacterized protein LOC128558150 [Mercenaria mercenaria]